MPAYLDGDLLFILSGQQGPSAPLVCFHKKNISIHKITNRLLLDHRLLPLSKGNHRSKKAATLQQERTRELSLHFLQLILSSSGCDISARDDQPGIRLTRFPLRTLPNLGASDILRHSL